MMNLNRRLIEQQGIDEEGEQKILALHRKREEIFNTMTELDPEDPRDVLTLREWAKKVEELEFKLQRAWKFSENADFHSWWFRVPHCCCPKMDNGDYVGTPLRVYTENCPIHGHRVKLKEY